jgi:hypothetical protein
MRSSSRSHALLHAAAWVYLGPLVVIGGLAIFVFGFGILAVLAQLLATLLKHVGA